MEGKSEGNWFDDDPEWRALRQRTSNHKVPKLKQHTKQSQHVIPEQPKLKNEKKTIQVSLNVALPKVPKLPKFTYNQLRFGIIAASLIVMVSLVGFMISRLNTNKPNKDGGPGVLSGAVQEPDFDTILPQGMKNETTSGKLSYDPDKKVASFTDTIGNVAITVSQQPLPENFKNNPDEEVKKLAENFSANEVIPDSNPKAYLGTSEKGPQTVIFHKKGLLVFIQSARAINNSDWSAYIMKLL